MLTAIETLSLSLLLLIGWCLLAMAALQQDSEPVE